MKKVILALASTLVVGVTALMAYCLYSSHDETNLAAFLMGYLCCFNLQGLRKLWTKFK